MAHLEGFRVEIGNLFSDVQNVGDTASIYACIVLVKSVINKNQN